MSAADRRLTQNVQQEIQDQFPDANINVTASQGTVTLRGTVRNNSERQEIEDIVQSIRGVQDVQNNLRVGSYQPQGYVSGVQEDRSDQDQYGQNAGPQGYGGRAGQDQSRGQMGGQQAAGGASDQALSRQIVQRLRQQLPDIQNVDVMRPGTIYVMVVQGTVMLHGFVQDVNLSQQATQIARDIPGVQNVTSTLSVGSGTGYPAFGYVPPESESARQPMRDQPQQDQQMQDQQMQDRQQQEQQPQGSQSGQQPSASQQRPGQQSPDLEEDQFDEGQPDPDMN